MTYRLKCGRGWFTIWYSKREQCWNIARYGTSIPRPTVTPIRTFANIYRVHKLFKTNRGIKFYVVG